MRRTGCGVCTGDLDVFLDLGTSPAANRYPAAPHEPEDRYPLQLGVCAGCGLVQLMDVVADSVLFGDDYGFHSGGSPAQLAYHAAAARLLLDRHGPQARRGVVEMACNDGSLLRHFADAGCPTLGVDPSGPAAVAVERGLDVVRAPLTVDLAEQVRAERGAAGLVVAYNAVAHVEHLPEVLDAVRTLMDRDSLAVFEVQYAGDLVAAGMWDTVYHEHRYYYTATSLAAAARRSGLYLADAELTELQGGGLRATFTTDPDTAPTTRAAATMRAERWLDPAGCAYRAMQGRAERTRDHLLSLLDAEAAAGRTVAGYAAAAKATTILGFCRLGPDRILYVADTTPYKQGRHVPGTAIPIVSPERADRQPADTWLLLAANYLPTVLRAMPDRRWVVPLPLPMVV